MHNRKLRTLSRRITHFLFYRSLGHGLVGAWSKAVQTI